MNEEPKFNKRSQVISKITTYIYVVIVVGLIHNVSTIIYE